MKSSSLKKNVVFVICIFLGRTVSALPAAPHAASPQKPAYSKKWTFLVYIASNNNLHRYAITNLEQMKQVGSTPYINVLAQVDTAGKKEVSRFFIEKNKVTLIEKKTNIPQSISGTPENLFDFVKWGLKQCPADHVALILWDHGTGVKDPPGWNRDIIGRHEGIFFKKNLKNGLLEINRDILRGIAFNDTAERYLTNQMLSQTLEKIRTELLNNKKIDILGMDACHMAMVEIGSQVKNSANYMVGSQEIEPANGWNYSFVLDPFNKKSLEPREFAIHIVNCYKRRYLNSFADFTQSATALNEFDLLEKNINQTAQTLSLILHTSGSKPIAQALQAIRSNKATTTCFWDSDYIDLHHFYLNLKQKLQLMTHTPQQKPLIAELKKNLDAGIGLIKKIIISNASGRNLPHASGLAIYFPTIRIHSSYPSSAFGQQKAWLAFLQTYLTSARLLKQDE